MAAISELTRHRNYPALFAALMLVTLLSVIDYYLTLIILGGGGREVNPVFAQLLPTRPIFSFALKFALTALGVTTLGALSDHLAARLAALALAGLYFGVIVYEVILLAAPL